MYNKKSIILIAATLFLFKSAHANVLYTMTGNDGLGNSFTLTFDWNSNTTSIDSVISASFIDRIGTYNMANPYISINPFHIGANGTGYSIDDWYPFQKNIVIGLTNTTAPFPTPMTSLGLEPYAMTVDGNATGCCYTYYRNLSTVSISPTIPSVPIPTSIVLFASGLLSFSSSRKRATQS